LRGHAGAVGGAPARACGALLARRGIRRGRPVQGETAAPGNTRRSAAEPSKRVCEVRVQKCALAFGGADEGVDGLEHEGLLVGRLATAATLCSDAAFDSPARRA